MQQPSAIRTSRTKIGLTLTSLALHAVVISSEAATTINIAALSDTDYYNPALSAILKNTSNSAFTSNFGTVFAGLRFGTISPTNYGFFCAELNQPLSLAAVTYTNYDDPYANFKDVDFQNGIPVDQGTPLSDRQMCLLAGVFNSLQVGTPTGFTSSSNQDLIGNSNTTGLDGLSDTKVLAAQLVIWEIIHENSDPNAVNGGQAQISLSSGNLIWDGGYNASWAPIPFTTALQNEFATITTAAYSYYCPVPEITSPVALIAGGLVFVRRRERRGSRLKSPVVR